MLTKIIANDLLKVYEKVQEKGKIKKKIITVLAWGDPIEVGEKKGKEISVQLNTRFWFKGEYRSIKKNGFVSASAKFINPEKNDVVKYSICDVQQGDASVLETPKGTRLFIDCGQNKLFARYLAARYTDTTKDKRLPVDAIIITHGDTDHYGGMFEIEKSESHKTLYKRLFIHPKVIYHNGLLKKSSKKAEAAFGPTIAKNGQRYISQLVDDITALKPEQMNNDFQKWQKVLLKWKNDQAIREHGGIRMQRLSDVTQKSAFDFLKKEGVEVEVLAPIEMSIGGSPALSLLKNPQKSVPESQGQALDANVRLSKSYSVSHTINGNSIVLLVSYGNIRLLLAGDINQQAERAILDVFARKGQSLRADVLKTPHHGSSDFSTKFIEQVQPIISVISSGDENERFEYIHPRATLVGALGKYSRVPQPLVFMTELVAFFKFRGMARAVDEKGATTKESPFYAFERTSYGIVHLCFNKERILVFTHSGKRDLKEAYAIKIDKNGKAMFDMVKIA